MHTSADFQVALLTGWQNNIIQGWKVVRCGWVHVPVVGVVVGLLFVTHSCPVVVDVIVLYSDSLSLVSYTLSELSTCQKRQPYEWRL